MKTLNTLFALGVALSFLVSCGATPAKVRSRTTSAVVRITTSVGVCSGFAIARDVVMTDYHCLDTTMYADDLMIGGIIHGDKYYDLAVLDVKGLSKKPLTVRDTPVTIGEELLGVGYGNGWVVPVSMDAVVLLPNFKVDMTAPMMVLTKGGFLRGMSGGPVVDSNGLVVSIVQRGLDGTDIGVGTDIIKAFLVDAGVR